MGKPTLTIAQFTALPNSFYSFAFDFIIGKLYANSLLATLNSRSALRSKEYGEVTVQGTALSFRSSSIATNDERPVPLRVPIRNDPGSRRRVTTDSTVRDVESKDEIRNQDSRHVWGERELLECLHAHILALASLMPPTPARFVFALVLAANALLWSQSRYAVRSDLSLSSQGDILVKRMSSELLNMSEPLVIQDQLPESEQCLPLAHSVSRQCAHVEESCPLSTTILSIDYIQRYFCTSMPLRPFSFVALTLWLFFLFSTLGISASDFFTPNLSTLAQILGLDENVAGVTILAFGNGSPDLFSTFSALRAGSGSLAIGELLGAASFIVSCVVGSMCITNEFKVERKPFLRDVGFFTVAVSVLLIILWDGKIEPWEAGLLVGLYVSYVILVVVGAFWDHKREKMRILANNGLTGDDPVDVPYRDDESPFAINVAPATPATSQTPVSSRPRINTGLVTRPNLHPHASRSRSRSPSPTPSHSHAKLPSFSLVGALEFAQVVSSLQREAAGPSLSMFDSPVTPYAGGHYHSHHSSRSLTPRTPVGREQNPWRNSREFDSRSRSSRQPSPSLSPIALEEPRLMRSSLSSDYFGRPSLLQLSPLSSSAALPSIIRTSASPTSSEDGESAGQLFVPRTRYEQFRHVIHQIFYVLFPSFRQFRNQPLLSRAVGILAAPAVLLLTLTLPVVVTPYDLDAASREKFHHANDSLLIDFEEEGEERALLAEEVVLEDLHVMEFNKWLLAVQCALAPLFCVAVLFHSSHRQTTYFIAAALAGCISSALVLLFSDKGNHPLARTARCSMGFAVAMVWIMAIADEIVFVLQTFGFIFGLSDALIGLTFFAIGNSLADLVANMSVAKFAPIMGFSACFGGPMLNILLGVGISGSYIIHQNGKPFDLSFSDTLFVSTVGLLVLLVATLVYVPLNHYHLTRGWGFALVSFYAILMTITIIVELRSESLQ
ncbi:hypothetical protein H0H93_010533 [Arthromyces matolae]|nr:hypothetical protein H0H93_010533 [Arthromyces matolae]